MDSIIASASKAFKSERLVYRAFDDKDEDLKAWIHEHITNDPVNDALGMANIPKPQTKKKSAEFVEAIARATLTVAICLPTPEHDEADHEGNGADAKKDNKPKEETIGFICLGGPPHMAHHQSASISISLAEKYQGRGYGGEAVNWIVDWGFRHANLHRIHISTISYNDRALALYQKLGFIVEGRERERIFYDRKRYDMVNMSMLATEWEELRKNGGVAKRW